LKVRIQLLSAAHPEKSFGMLAVAKETIGKNGPLGLYKG